MTTGDGGIKGQSGPTLVDLCREAADGLDRARGLQAPRFGQEVEAAQRAVVRVRDSLIERLRQDSRSQDAAELRAALGHINTTLSVTVGLVFRSAGIRRDLLDDARQPLLQAIDLSVISGKGRPGPAPRAPESTYVPPLVDAEALPGQEYPAQGVN